MKMNNKIAQANKSVGTKTIRKMQKSPIAYSLVAGLVLSSVSIVAEATAPSYKEKPAFTMKIESVDDSSNTTVISGDNDQSVKPAKTTDEVINKSANQTDNQSDNQSASRSIRLKDGGVIWVSKDPSTLTPVLNVTAPNSIEMEKGEFVSAMNFEITTNYAHFIDSWELEVYYAEDEQQKHPIASFMGKSLENGRTVKWNCSNKKENKLKEGDKLSYILTVKDKDGHLDRTHLRQISLVGPQRNITDTVSSSVSSNLENNLDLQTIPVHGSRVRIFGRDIPTDHTIKINDESISLVENKFVVEKLLPEGQHDFDIAITDSNQDTYHKPLNVDLKSKYMFMVGLADITAGKGKVSGNLETLSDGDKYLDGDIFVDGRLAFYLKGKIKGKYLVTAQMDTGTDDIENIFDNIHKKDPDSLFRRLDPDKYYPVYGDDSTIIDDTNSQGKMYVRVDWDKSRAIWGNYNTDITGTELSSFNRTLYGAKLNHKSTQTTKDGDHKTDVTVFASEAQSAFRHNEFLGTGGSLYYLKDSDIVDGSEKVWIEVRQSSGDRAVSTVVLEEGRDYQIDDFQGRIILNRPLLQIAQQSYPSLIKDTPLDGDDVYLMVDYEYVPDDFDSNKASYGSRGKIWLNDHFAVGGTYAHENRTDDDYDLKGIDITLKKNKGTYLKVEYAESESNQTQGSFASNDGGLNFNPFNANSEASDINGSAISVEARADLEDFSTLSGSIGAWFKQRDAGFSTASLDTGYKTTDTGVEVISKINDKVDVSARVTQVEEEGLRKESSASVQADVKVSDKVTLSGEIRHVKEEDLTDDEGTGSSVDGEGTLAAFKVGYDVNNEINLYGIAQGTLSKSGNYESNDLLTLGIKAAINSKFDLNAEVSSGDRGDALTLGADYRMSDSYSLYSNFTLSTDGTEDNKNAFTMGQRKTVSDQLKVYTEHQFTHESAQSGIGHTFGVDYQVNKELIASASVQSSRLDKVDSGLTDRDAFSVGLTYKENATDASTRLEYRRDKGFTEDTVQWVTTNKINYRVNPSLRLQGKFNYSDTKDQVGDTNDATFTEAAVGFAYRPINHDRLNVLGRITYLYDLQPVSQSIEPDEKSLIASLESSYQLNQRWELGGKLAHKEGEIRSDRDAGNWSRNDATLAAVRVRYHMTKNWDAMAQYHWLNSDESQDTQHGAMIAVDRHIGENMKIGLGYNFTNFNDDLSNTDGDAEGWFINLVGKY
ncbi:hypothetical protein OO007_09005 [Cocleimonas sp. KMM 6892]|uniref:hypothetical protein n=1 Tax=unclassified Cocleimonas TaxID=2639732 RepID=UPI002DC0398D|nr:MULTISPECIES: hypothetical protein [unclassified Cocleimonas]MEB8432361.1 hypothetical protein [Cocleimonas sp. KMM 6892]MEC4714553.1 hypothetical protein [Cocleimonas sp. KMM 6895]MEC4744633.1 hypothetical protein [Cocleimonas sp. KMM 6896]